MPCTASPHRPRSNGGPRPGATSAASTGCGRWPSSPCCCSTAATCRAGSSASTCSSPSPASSSRPCWYATLTVRGIHLTAFWGRRFRRLLPALLALIAVVAAWVAAFGSPAELDSVRRDGPWALGYLANWHAIAESGGYWQSFQQPSMFDHLWSLAIEEQFYLVWPIVLAVVWRWAPRPSRALVTTCIAGIVASLVTMVVLAGPGDPTRVYMGTDTRARLSARRGARRHRPVPPPRGPAGRPGRRHRARGGRRRPRAVVVGRRRRGQLGTALPRRPRRPLGAVRAGGRRRRDRARRDRRPGARVPAAGVDRRDVLRPLPLALAGVRRAVAGAHRARRAAVAGPAAGRGRGVRGGLVPARRGSGAPTGRVDPRPGRAPGAGRCGPPRRHRPRRAADAGHRDRRLRSGVGGGRRARRPARPRRPPTQPVRRRRHRPPRQR